MPYYNYVTAIGLGHKHYFHLGWFESYNIQNKGDFVVIKEIAHPSVVGRFIPSKMLRKYVSYFIGSIIKEIETYVKKV